MKAQLCLALAPAILLAACDGGAADAPAADATPTAAATIPASLAPFGDGYPNGGDPCRRAGESAATSNWLDDSSALVACPDEASAKALGGKIVGQVDGATVVSVPMGDANADMENGPMAAAGSDDALVAGTDYNATTMVDCGFANAPAKQSCNAGIKRNWGEPGKALIEVTKPDGRKRGLFFDGTTPTGADSAQADGSAGWDFKYTRSGDQTTIRFGPETYVIVDAMIEGG